MVSVEHVESEDGDGVRGALELVADDDCLGLAHIHFLQQIDGVIAREIFLHECRGFQELIVLIHHG